MEKKTLKLNYEPPQMAVFGSVEVEMGFCGSGDTIESDSNERYGSYNYTWE